MNIEGVATPGVDLPDDLRYQGPEECGPSTCYDEHVEQCLDEQTKNYPVRQYPETGGVTLFGGQSGPNSNTFARRLLACGGLSVPASANEVNAPGWNYFYSRP